MSRRQLYYKYYLVLIYNSCYRPMAIEAIVFRLEGVPLSAKAITMLVKAPVHRSTVAVTARQLLEGRWVAEVRNWKEHDYSLDEATGVPC